jgi:hypothetical protein
MAHYEIYAIRTFSIGKTVFREDETIEIYQLEKRELAENAIKNYEYFDFPVSLREVE